MNIRELTQKDNESMATIINSILENEFNAGEGTSRNDSVTQNLFEFYKRPNSIYFVVELNGNLVGGCGIAPLLGAESIAELQKLFIVAGYRGSGFGRQLIDLCLKKAKSFGFSQVYLETLSVMQPAKHLYQSIGFRELSEPLGNTGHHACDEYFIIDV